MPLWTDIAEWRGPVLHHSGTIADHMYVVIHTADGSYEGTISWQKNEDSGNSSHFVVDYDGKIAQVNDTANRSGAQIDGNPYSIAVENAGNENKPLTPQQVEANARILAKAHQVHGVPLQLTDRVGTRGLGHHSMGAESGVRWGHAACPGEIIKAQKPAILARAKEIVAGGDDDMTPDQAKQLADVHYALTSGQYGPEQVRWSTGMAKLDLIASKLGVAQADLDDIQARVGPVDVSALAAALAAALPSSVDSSVVLAAFQTDAVKQILTGAAEAGANLAEDS
jgi:hypothetical protein